MSSSDGIPPSKLGIRCPLCPNGSEMTSVNEHVANAHSGYKPFRCLLCPRSESFASVEESSRHADSVHPGQPKKLGLVREPVHEAFHKALVATVLASSVLPEIELLKCLTLRDHGYGTENSFQFQDAGSVENRGKTERPDEDDMDCNVCKHGTCSCRRPLQPIQKRHSCTGCGKRYRKPRQLLAHRRHCGIEMVNLETGAVVHPDTYVPIHPDIDPPVPINPAPSGMDPPGPVIPAPELGNVEDEGDNGPGHDASAGGMISCLTCRRTMSESALSQHECARKGDLCGNCGRVFRSSTALRMHNNRWCKENGTQLATKGNATLRVKPKPKSRPRSLTCLVSDLVHKPSVVTPKRAAKQRGRDRVKAFITAADDVDVFLASQRKTTVNKQEIEDVPPKAKKSRQGKSTVKAEERRYVCPVPACRKAFRHQTSLYNHKIRARHALSTIKKRKLLQLQANGTPPITNSASNSRGRKSPSSENSSPVPTMSMIDLTSSPAPSSPTPSSPTPSPAPSSTSSKPSLLHSEAENEQKVFSGEGVGLNYATPSNREPLNPPSNLFDCFPSTSADIL